MATAEEPSWHSTLVEMEQSLHLCLAKLEHFETGFQKLLCVHVTVPNELHLPDIDAGWSERLHIAQEQATSVEALLREQEAVWLNWQRTYAAWRQSLEQRPAAA